MLTIQQIFTEYKEAYEQKYKMSTDQKKAFTHIVECRTEKYGTHIDVCEECGYERILYNSCKDRNCPQCQTFKKEEWINNRKAEVIGTRYFHVVLTLPKELNVIAMQNQKEVYSIMFKASSEAIKELTADKKYIGACPGFISVLHTWGQTLEYHPHIHMIVTGGGLNGINKWKKSGKKFFAPAKKLSIKFRRKFMDYLKEAYATNKLNFYGSIIGYEDSNEFQKLVDTLYEISWYSYIKKPFDGPGAVIEYLGRYTHRIAISNSRIVKVEDGKVFFKWKDYKDENKIKVMSLEINEFIRRFLLHVLPSGFVKIRYYGIIANRNKKTKLVLCQKLTDTLNNPAYRKLTKLELLMKVTNGKAFICPCCRNNSLKRLGNWNIQENTS